MRFLVEHLVRVAALHEVNKMSGENLAIVFGPTMLHPGADRAAVANPAEIMAQGQHTLLTLMT